MLTINRYNAADVDGTEAGPSTPSPSNSNAPASRRLAALAEKKKRKRGDDEDSGSANRTTGPSSDVNASTPTTAPPPPRAGVPQIHPSRLSSAPLLAQSFKKASTASGVQKEKTKAKQRYLNKKKLKRKANKKSKKGGAEGKDQEAAAAAAAVITAATSRPRPTPLPTPIPTSAANTARTEQQADASMTNASSASSSSRDSDSDSDDSDDSSDSDDSNNADDKIDGAHASATVPPPAPEANTLVPLPRSRPLHHASQEALRSLAAQGLPRGMVEPRVIDPSLREAVRCHDKTSTHLGIQLSASMAQRLSDMGVTEWFAVQSAVIPHLLAVPSHPSPYNPPRDLCVSAPTGSGKTLAYAIPIVSHLQHRIIPRLRALVVLPTRDLILQVRETMELLSRGTGLKIASTSSGAGTQSFSQEQGILTAGDVDVLITTPGRLVDHIDETRGFTLEHLRFLVIDEADRLLGQSFHDWAKRLRDSLAGEGVGCDDGDDDKGEVNPAHCDDDVTETRAAAAVTPRQYAPHRLHKLFPFQSDRAASDPFQAQSIAQKLLFSATLTRDVGKLAELGLRDPVFIDVRGRDGSAEDNAAAAAAAASTTTYTLPPGLREHMLVTSSADKPLALLWLLSTNPVKDTAASEQKRTTWSASPNGPMSRVLVFTKSVDSSHRLVRLLQSYFGGGRDTHATVVVSAYTSDLSPSERKQTLDAFKSGRVQVLVASDLISRGIDVQGVEHVVSYDTPSDVAKYVHRAGRTARGAGAGARGDAWSLVEEQEARWFKRSIGGARGGGGGGGGGGEEDATTATTATIARSTPVQRIKIDVHTVLSEDVKSRYAQALKETVQAFKPSAARV